jgi:hypothetical protein
MFSHSSPGVPGSFKQLTWIHFRHDEHGTCQKVSVPPTPDEEIRAPFTGRFRYRTSPAGKGRQLVIDGMVLRLPRGVQFVPPHEVHRDGHLSLAVGAGHGHRSGTPDRAVTPVTAYTNSGLPKLGYNALLCNLYRDGNDSVGLHADAEPEMGPVLASISLGAGRLFRLKRENGSVAFSERLPHGSLLVMAGDTQKRFKHEVPKERGVTQPRINLTFRRVEHK